MEGTSTAGRSSARYSWAAVSSPRFSQRHHCNRNRSIPAGVQILDRCLFETRERGPALMDARPGRDHEMAGILGRPPDGLHDLRPPPLVGGFIQASSSTIVSFVSSFSGRTPHPDPIPVEARKCAIQRAVYRRSGVSWLAIRQRIRDVLVKLADPHPERKPAATGRSGGGPAGRHSIHAIQRTNVVLPPPGLPSITSLRWLRNASSRGIGLRPSRRPLFAAGAAVISRMKSRSMAGGGTSWRRDLQLVQLDGAGSGPAATPRYFAGLPGLSPGPFGSRANSPGLLLLPLWHAGIEFPWAAGNRAGLRGRSGECEKLFRYW